MTAPQVDARAGDREARLLDEDAQAQRANWESARGDGPSLAELFRVRPQELERRSTEDEAQELTFAPPMPESATGELAAAHRPGAWARVRVSTKRLLAARLTVAFLLQLGLAGLVAHTLFFNLSVVRGTSMNPGIRDGDRILIDHFAYLFSDVQRGEVVVLKYPLDPAVDYIKRVIGLPGDEIELEEGQVFVNGVALDEPYISTADPMTRLSVRVKPAHVFVLGDNRPRSSDSRDFGQVPIDYVRGRVEVRLWPLERIGSVN